MKWFQMRSAVDVHVSNKVVSMQSVLDNANPAFWVRPSTVNLIFHFLDAQHCLVEESLSLPLPQKKHLLLAFAHVFVCCWQFFCSLTAKSKAWFLLWSKSFKSRLSCGPSNSQVKKEQEAVNEEKLTFQKHHLDRCSVKNAPTIAARIK